MESIDTGTNELLCEIKDRVATITLNRPEKKNALSEKLTPALRETLLILDGKKNVGCIVITGAGNAFCAGGDIGGMNSNIRAASSTKDEKTTTEQKIRELIHKQETLTHRLVYHSKPTIASLPGAAAGAGMCIALACDIRIGSESSFLTTGYRNIGFPGDYGGSWLLSKIVGPSKAKELYFTGDRVPSAEALRLGIYNQVAKDDQLKQTTSVLAQKIASGPPIALGYMKENINMALTNDLRTSMALEADRLMRCADTSDHKEAVAAFLEKRRPSFKGI